MGNFINSMDNLKETITEGTNNGYVLSGYDIPEEMLLQVLSFIPPKEILKCSTVCKEWNKLIKSNTLWIEMYKRKYKNKRPKQLPWYVYYALFATDFFDVNLLKNGNGQNKFNNWTINKNFGDGFCIEDPPHGCNLLPIDVEEFKESTSCFATSYGECNKEQVIRLIGRNLFTRILNEYKPKVSVSEWICGRFDCACTYTLRVKIISRSKKEILKEYVLIERMEQWRDLPWKKMTMILEDYPDDVTKLIFEHEGKDLQFWKGHYGSKMAGGVVKILFDSLQD